MVSTLKTYEKNCVSKRINKNSKKLKLKEKR